MNDRIRQIIAQIATLESDLQTAIAHKEEHLRYRIEGERIIFEQTIRDAQKRLKLGVFRWFLTVRPQNYLTMPIIYGMAIPLALFDLTVSFYQMTCFPVYRIARVKRSDYIVFDHYLLAYLNIIEKAHCLYCSYAVGLLAYSGEIVSRTEQYFCPIKHARQMPGVYARYANFLEYGDADKLHAKFEALRTELADKNTIDTSL